MSSTGNRARHRPGPIRRHIGLTQAMWRRLCQGIRQFLTKRRRLRLRPFIAENHRNRFEFELLGRLESQMPVNNCAVRKGKNQHLEAKFPDRPAIRSTTAFFSNCALTRTDLLPPAQLSRPFTPLGNARAGPRARSRANRSRDADPPPQV